MTEKMQRLEGFAPEHEELLAIVRFWADVSLNRHLDWFLYGQAGGWNREMHALYRIEKLEEVLGKEAVDQQFKIVHKAAAAQLGPRLWDIFLNGNDEQRQAVRDEIDRKVMKGAPKPTRSRSTAP